MTDTASNKSPWIVETDEPTFEQDVFERSKETPVVVDFWAAWCAPCRMLAPVLESLADEYAGRFVLVKADTDRVPGAAGQFGVQGIPAVYGVIGGQVVEYFAGALPEEQIRPWLDRLLAAAELDQATRLEETDPAAAEATYRKLLEQVPNEATASIGLARSLIAQERDDEARAVIDQLQERGFLEPEAEKVKAELELRGMKGGNIDELRTNAQSNPDDLNVQFQLAEALAAAKQYEPALELCLKIVERDKKGVGEQARQLMVDVFRVLPDDSELTPTYRRRLSTLLY